MYCSEAAKAWIRAFAAAVLYFVHRLSSLFHQVITLLPRYLDLNRTEARLPVQGGVPLPTECNGDEKVTSWAKVNLVLSFSAGLALLNIPSSFISQHFTSFSTYTIGVYVAFLLSMIVYCTPSCLYKTIKVTILSISSGIISVAYALVLKVVLGKGATSVTHAL